ncbi:MFS-type transporter-like protein [Dinothrombium tinctorium]|uniref:MFS-type transporter-like protein n=1 Tax=Dinothrombium tinctorium TaxID=1965070 RepID=A0A3S3PZ74_9ACAR|nr:MFS-type transporter-like protein [Dinothrombium tinctorium]RWS00413.1 MFS-type transporter-like protein [Dinothrombium tinctorium]RWS00521.1 MFS-type transporter-like protein [Dinothrombium tinctorium]
MFKSGREASNFYQHYEYTAISNVVSKYYNVGANWVNITAVIFYSSALIAFYPMLHCLQKYGLQTTTYLAFFVNAIGPCIKCFALRKSLYWLILFGQLFPALANISQPCLTTIFAANWFESEEVAFVISTNSISLALGSSIAFLSPTLFFGNVTNDEEMFNGLSFLSTTLALVTSILFVIAVLLIKEKPPTPPSMAEKNREDHLQNRSFRVLLKNRNFILLAIIFSLVTAVSQTLSVVLNQSIFLQFSHANHIVTIAGLLSLIPGIISSPLTGLICKRYKRYKRLHIIYSLLMIIFLGFYILSLNLKCKAWIYISVFFAGFFFSGIYVIVMDFVIEVTYPYPESVTKKCTDLRRTMRQLIY